MKNEDIATIDYTNVREKIEEQRQKGLDFLKKRRFLPIKSLLREKKQVIFVYIVQYRCGYVAKNLRNDGEKTLEKSEKV